MGQWILYVLETMCICSVTNVYALHDQNTTHFDVWKWIVTVMAIYATSRLMVLDCAKNEW